MDTRRDALLQIRTMLAGQLSVKAYLAWRAATRAAVDALVDIDLAQLVTMVDFAIEQFNRREMQNGAELRDVLRLRIADAGLALLLTEPLLPAKARPS